MGSLEISPIVPLNIKFEKYSHLLYNIVLKLAEIMCLVCQTRTNLHSGKLGNLQTFSEYNFQDVCIAQLTSWIKLKDLQGFGKLNGQKHNSNLVSVCFRKYIIRTLDVRWGKGKKKLLKSQKIFFLGSFKSFDMSN